MFYQIIKHGAKVKNHPPPPHPPTPIYWFSRSKSCISGLKIHIKKKKNTQLGRESSNECSAFFLWTKKAFSYKIVFRGIQRRFSSSRRSAKCPVLKFNQGNKFLKTFQVHFFLLYSPENSFKKWITKWLEQSRSMEKLSTASPVSLYTSFVL